MNKKIVVNGEEYNYNLNKKKVKNLTIKVKDTGEMIVTAPVALTQKRIEEFIVSKADWIKKSLKKADIINKERSYRDIRILGKSLSIHIFKSDKRCVALNDGGLSLFILEHDDNFKIKKQFYQWYCDLAEKTFGQANAKIFEKLGGLKKESAEIKIRDMKARWGSCYYNKNTIILNRHLVQLPIEAIDHVLLHEYAHFFQHNHGKDFKDFLRCYEENSDNLEKYVRHQNHDDVDINSIILREIG